MLVFLTMATQPPEDVLGAVQAFVGADEPERHPGVGEQVVAPEANGGLDGAFGDGPVPGGPGPDGGLSDVQQAFRDFVERTEVYDKALALSEKIFASLGLPKPV